MRLCLHELVREVQKENRPVVYVSGPLTCGGKNAKEIVHRNVTEAVKLGDLLWDKGYLPIVPHITEAWQAITPKKWEWWMRYDAHQIARCCDALYRFGGPSEGADLEVELAHRFQIPVFVTLGELDQHFRKETPATSPIVAPRPQVQEDIDD